jgi:hypothetical protein
MLVSRRDSSKFGFFLIQGALRGSIERAD